MKTLGKVCAVLIFTVFANFGILAQENKQTPEKDKTPKVVVKKDKEEDKQPDKNRDKDNKSRDKDNKKPGDE